MRVCSISNGLKRWLYSARNQQCRHASLTGAIEKGLRRGQVDRIERQAKRSSWAEKRTEEIRERLPRTKEYKPKDFQDDESRSTVSKSLERRKFIIAPRTIPYTTAGSQFLYGTSAVDAAIRAHRRQLYKLYIYGEENEQERDVQVQSQKLGLQKLALAAGVKVQKVEGVAWRAMLDKMSGGRPHNGVVLETSTLPQLVLESLQQHESPAHPLRVQLGHHSIEERDIASKVFEISGTTASIPSPRSDGSFPFLLLLDRVTDPGNFGSILRSAYYFGVDGIIILEHGSAPFSAVSVKASAGAAEYVPIFRIKDEVKFVRSARENGWKFFAAVAPDSVSSNKASSARRAMHTSMSSTLRQKPCVLMLGNEGSGLRPRLSKLADEVVSVPGAEGKHQGVDSLNVGVAAALLIRDFLTPPMQQDPIEVKPDVANEAIFSYVS